jgi:hypothetical protein
MNICHCFLVDVTVYSQTRPQNSLLSLEEMGNILLDAMQGTLICLDNHHTIVDVSRTIKRYLGFEQVIVDEIVDKRFLVRH